MGENMTYANLFSPMQIGSLNLKNRVVMAPMSTGLGGTDGAVTAENIAFYRERALGGFGLIIVEFTCVDPATGRTEERQLSLDSERNLDGHARLVDMLHEAGAKAFVQLQHGGRFSPAHLLPDRVTRGPGEVRSRKDPSKIIVQPFTSAEVHRLVDSFARSAELAARAGYDGIELHGAHGYLLSQFLSPFSNQRDDEWGGDAERRLAFPLAVIRSIRSAIGDLPLCFRLSAEEFVPGGLSIEDNVVLAPRLVEAGTTIIHASTGRGPEAFDKVMEPISAPEGWRLPYARRLREATGVPVIGVGQIRWPETAEAALDRGDADLIALGRPSLADPAWPNKAEAGLRDTIRPCTSCNWCISGTHPHVGCAENPRAGHELDPVLALPEGTNLRAVVMGAGPAGMAAALMLDQAGYETHLLEQRSHMGGGLVASGAPPGKDKFNWYRDYLERQIERSRIQVHLGQGSAAEALALSPDLAVVATGTMNRPMEIPGRDQPLVSDAFEVLMGDAPVLVKEGESAVVYGGGETGCETAEFLAERGIKAYLVSRSPAGKLARSAELVYRTGLLRRLAEDPMIEVVAEAHIARITADGAIVQLADGSERHLPAGQVLIAQGRDSSNDVARELVQAGVPCHVVGDSRQVGRIGDAVHGAYQAARAIIAERTAAQALAC
jgi:2,4-dienoyl-CoA reductase-like NADH-dependent reductase (Old Yellow Enzyme family)/thioredoxin reductase